MAEIVDVSQLRSDFLQVLRSRRNPEEVPLVWSPAEPVKDPLYQETPKPRFSKAMASCPKKEIPNFQELLREENFYLTTEAGEQGRLPVLILSIQDDSHKKRPAVVFLHRTNTCKEWLRPLLEGYASRGYIAVAIDSRYHGERASNLTSYSDALVSAWKKGETMPFIFDTVWDLIKLADYLSSREDIDPLRIGITGESLGGMHAWFAGFVDIRYSVIVPIIGVQGFRWAIDHDKWKARVNSIKAVFEEAMIDLGKAAIDKEVVEKVWDRIAPGLDSKFDAPQTIPAMAPRPLLILNGMIILFFTNFMVIIFIFIQDESIDLREFRTAEDDPRCPMGGLEAPSLRARKIYDEANVSDNFKFIAQVGIRHWITPEMIKEASDWFDKFFNVL